MAELPQEDLPGSSLCISSQETCPIPPPSGRQGPSLLGGGWRKGPWLGCLSGLRLVEDFTTQGSLFEAVQEALVQDKPLHVPKDVVDFRS